MLVSLYSFEENFIGGAVLGEEMARLPLLFSEPRWGLAGDMHGTLRIKPYTEPGRAPDSSR